MKFFYSIITACLLLLSACKKSENLQNPGNQPDLVRGAFSGFVYDQSNHPLSGVSVTIAGILVNSDANGFFQVNDVSVIGQYAVIEFEKNGYFTSYKTVMAQEGKTVFTKIRLITKQSAGIISGSTGGSVSLANGLSITLNANSIVQVANNAAYTGDVHMFVHWLNPDNPEMPMIMPGDLRGVNLQGAIKGLTTFGMVAVEMNGSGGELLQIAPGQSALLKMPIPSSLLSTAPTSMPIWSFNSTNGLWKEEGMASKTGNNYEANVSHFSFWNLDMPGEYVEFECTLIDTAFGPIHNALVKISSSTNPATAAYAYSNQFGFVHGWVPANASLRLEVLGDVTCNFSYYTQNFSTTTTPVNLGSVPVIGISMATIRGTVVDCQGNPVSQASLLILPPPYYIPLLKRIPVSANGTFDFTIPAPLCSSGPLRIIAEDFDSNSFSDTNYVQLTQGINQIGQVSACGNVLQEYFNCTINGQPYYSTKSYEKPLISFGMNNLTNIYSSLTLDSLMFYTVNFSRTGIMPNAPIPLIYFSSSITDVMYANPYPSQYIQINEWASQIGQYCSGSFSGNLSNGTTNYTISFSFRLKRSYN